MDVRELVTLLARRWWLVAGIPAVVLGVSLLTWRTPPATYEARLRIAVDIPRTALVEGSDEGTAAKIGQALIDDIARVIPSQAFAAAVAARLPAPVEVDPGQIASELSATDRHRVADVWVRRTAPSGAGAAEVARLQQDLQAIAEGAVAELEANGNEWFARLGEDDVALTVIDRPRVSAVLPSLRQRLELPLRVALALAVAVALAFLLHAVDPRLYGPDEAVAATGAPVIGRVPRPKTSRPW